MNDKLGLKKLYKVFTPSERKKALILLILSMATAISQAVGVFSIFPFIDVLMQPELIETNAVYSYIYELFNFRSTNVFLTVLGMAVFVIMVGSNGLSILTLWFKTRFVFNRNHAISKRLLEVYLKRDYEFFLGRNTSELSKNILQEVNHLTQKYLIALFEIIINIMILLFIIITILIIEPIVTGIAVLFFGIVYLFTNHFVKNALKKRGEKRLIVNKERFKMANEALSSIKTTKVYGVESFFLNKYAKNSSLFARYNSFSRIAGQMPRFIIEAVAFGALVLFVVVQLLLGNDITSMISVVAVLAFAGYRMLPAVQKVFQSASEIYYNRPILDKVFEDLYDKKHMSKVDFKTFPPLEFTHSITVNNIEFAYDGSANKKVLKALNLKIEKGQIVGFKGPSGSGKTTLIDILMGLLEPTNGEVLIDETPLKKSLIRSWQAKIGYVPQDIYLSDDTIANNIAFGFGDEKIDCNKVKDVAKIAALDDFIENELEDKYQTIVGERGVRLSGGQKQRIGLARALYKNPEVLVLDEATSALDNETEKSVIKAIENAAKNRTVLMIAHRLTTLEKCDLVYEVNKGILKAVDQ